MIAIMVLALIGSAYGQAEFRCECGVFVDVLGFPPVSVGPLYPLANTSSTCDEPGEVNCDATCVNSFNSFIPSFNFTSAKPDDAEGRTWGKYFCDAARASSGINDDAITSDLEAWNRIDGCPDYQQYSFVTDQPRKVLCCDQVGNHVNC